MIAETPAPRVLEELEDTIDPVISARRRNTEAVILLVAVIATVFLLRPDWYDTHVLTLIAIYFLAGVGLNVLVGYAGIISVGHAAFMMIGAYSWARIANADSRVSWVVAVLVGIALAILVSGGLGWVALRFRGYYLAIATLAFGLGAWAVARHASTLTFGNDGVPNVYQVALPGIGSQYSVLLMAGILAAVFWWYHVLLRASTLGNEMLATRGNEIASQSAGIFVPWVRVIAFVLSAPPATVAGILLAQQTRFVHPDQFMVLISVQLIAIPIIGGRGWRWAPLLGACFTVALPEYARFLDDYRLVVYGLSLMVVVLFLPGGLREVGRLLARAVSRIGRHRDGAGRSAEARPKDVAS